MAAELREAMTFTLKRIGSRFSELRPLRTRHLLVWAETPRARTVHAAAAVGVAEQAVEQAWVSDAHRSKAGVAIATVTAASVAGADVGAVGNGVAATVSVRQVLPRLPAQARRFKVADRFRSAALRTRRLRVVGAADPWGAVVVTPAAPAATRAVVEISPILQRLELTPCL